MTAPSSSTAQLPADWRARLRRGLKALPDHRLEASRFGGLPGELPPALLQQLRASVTPALHAAAVLVPIIERPEAPGLLLTVRASHLRRHAGQVSFPGGRLELQDADLAAAALRETAEEIGIAAGFIQTLGFLCDHIVQSGYRITPVVALLQPGFTLAPDITEVAEVFELPLSLALDSASYRSRRRLLHGRELDIWELPYGKHNIWGATAGILANLREVMVGAQA